MAEPWPSLDANFGLPILDRRSPGWQFFLTSREVATKGTKRGREVRNEDEKIEQQKLPDELWSKVLESVDDASVFAFASTCKQLRHVQEESGRKLETNLKNYSPLDKHKWWRHHHVLKPRSEAWCLWSWSLTSTEDERVRASIIRVAAYWGHFSALKLFTEENGEQRSLASEDLLLYAAQGGQLDGVIWLNQKGMPWDEMICDLAAQEGHLDLLKYARAHGCPWEPKDRWHTAEPARKGQFQVLQCLKESGCPLDEKTFAGAASSGSMEMLRWLKDQECPWNEGACAESKNVEILKWLRSHGCPWDKSTCSDSAEHGQFEKLKWAHEHGCPWDETTFANAAKEGSFVLLFWLRAQGCPWGETTFANAVNGGDLEVLAWLRAQGCPWDEKACAAAKKVEVIRWLREHGCPWDESTTRIATDRPDGATEPLFVTFINFWASNRRLDVVKWAIEHGCPWNRARTREVAASLRGQEWNKFVEWIDEHVNSL